MFAYELTEIDKELLYNLFQWQLDLMDKCLLTKMSIISNIVRNNC